MKKLLQLVDKDMKKLVLEVQQLLSSLMTDASTWMLKLAGNNSDEALLQMQYLQGFVHTTTNNLKMIDDFFERTALDNKSEPMFLVKMEDELKAMQVVLLKIKDNSSMQLIKVRKVLDSL